MWWGIVVISGFLEGLGLCYKKPIFPCHVFFYCPISFVPYLAGMFLSDVLLMRNFNPLNFYLFTVRTPHR